MASLLSELLLDAELRAKEVADELASLQGIGAEVEHYRAKMQQRAVRARQVVADMLSDPDLNDPALAVNFYRGFKAVARLIQSLEHLPLLVLRRFDDGDKWMTVLVSKICQEIGYPFDAPICSAISSQYYWTVAGMDLVFVPSLEPGHLLALPDIHHELGHIVLYREESRLVYPGLALVDKHFDEIVADGMRANWPQSSIDEVERFRHQWRETWLIEFGADLIATFVIGPAFGWCNIRTSTNLGGELFEGSESHPADDARASAIAMMLNRIGETGPASEIEGRWKELVKLSGESPPQRYDLAYPKGLLQDLRNLFFTECANIGLLAWSGSPNTPIGDAINEAWDEFRSNPASFGAYEKQQLSKLGSVLGISWS